MKHIIKFNESNKKGRISGLGRLTKDTVIDYFSHSFDLAKEYEIDIVYANTKNKRDFAGNDFSNDDLGVACLQGFQIYLSHDAFDDFEIKDFKKYLELLNEVDSDMDRFRYDFKEYDVFFTETSNSSLSFIII